MTKQSKNKSIAFISVPFPLRASACYSHGSAPHSLETAVIYTFNYLYFVHRNKCL